ncbi:MAG: hypothetical protein RSD40_01535 [Bacilli bacterium]
MKTIKYEERTLVDRTRTIEFKPYTNKNDETKTYKPLVQKV